MAERPTFLRLLDYQPVAEVLALHIVSGMRASRREPSDFVMKRGYIRNRWGKFDERVANVWSAARTCHKMYALLASALYTKLELLIEDVSIAADMLPSAKGSVKELCFYTTDSRHENEDNFDILTGLRFPHVTHLLAYTASHPILFEGVRLCPQLQHLTYTETFRDIESMAISKAFFSSSVPRYTCPEPPLLDRSEELIGDWLRAEAAGAGYAAVFGEWGDPLSLHQVLATTLESSGPPRNLLVFDDHSPPSDFNLVGMDWPLGLQSVKVVMERTLVDLAGMVYVIHTLLKPEDEEKRAKWDKKRYRKLPADRSWWRDRFWAKELWQEILEIESRPPLE